MVSWLWQLLINSDSKTTDWALTVEALWFIVNLDCTQQRLLVLFLCLHVLTYETGEELANSFGKRR